MITKQTEIKFLNKVNMEIIQLSYKRGDLLDTVKALLKFSEKLSLDLT